MKYFIQEKEVSEEEFYSEFEKELEDYEPISEYWPKKEEVKNKLKKERSFRFISTKKRDYGHSFKEFTIVEEGILELQKLIEQNQFDPEDDDSLTIALALWNEGYRKIEECRYKEED